MQPSGPIKKWQHTILLCVLSIGVVLTGQYVSQIHGIHHEYQKPPLYDIIHDHIPSMADYSWVNWVLLIVAVVRFLSLKQNFQDYLFLTCVAMNVRALTLMVTSQPSCVPSCQTDPGSFPINTCFDFLYSGHEVCIAISCICIIRDSDCRRYEKFWWALYILMSAFWIAISRQHYTADVIIAMVIAYLMCYLRFLEKSVRLTVQ